MISSRHVYEVRPRKDRRGLDLISDAHDAANVLATHEHIGDFKGR